MRSRALDRAPSGQVAIVEVDAKSIAAIDAWPWSRRYHAELVRRLGAAHASLIAFDVDFSARSDAVGDAEFAKILHQVRPVILPIFQQRASDSASDGMIVKSRPAPAFGEAWVGGVNIMPAPDGIVRDFPAATMIGGQIQPAMPALLADSSEMGDRTFAPDWSIDARRIPRYSFIDVIRGRVPATAFAGKRVIVGATAIEMGDRYPIPRFGTVPGVVIQALASESLLQHRAMSRSGVLPTLLGIGLIGLVLGRMRWRFVPPAVVGLLGLLVALPLCIQSQWPLSIDTAPMLLVAVSAAALRAIAEARRRTRAAALGDHDSGLPNHRAIAARLLAEATTGTNLAVAAIDRFELIRNTIGAAAATEVVCLTSERMAGAIGTTVYRVAPDALAWISAPGIDLETQASGLGALFIAPVPTASGPVDVNLTFGFAASRPELADVQLEQALSAANQARTSGQRHGWFGGVSPTAVRDLSIIGDMRRGIEAGELFVVYQPKLDLRSGAITQAEALVRWQHPVEGLIRPDRFLPLAEETGAVRELTQFVLNRVLDDARSAEEASFGISVNVSAADIGHAGFAGTVLDALARAGIAPGRLTLEITESAIIRSRDTALQVLKTLRDAGVRLSVDDYGTGQSTLTYLKALPLDELKIDKSFVTALATNPADRIMVRSTIDLAHQLGLTVVAEGVEDWETAKLLAEMECDYAQGFVVGRGCSFADLNAAPNRKAA